MSGAQAASDLQRLHELRRAIQGGFTAVADGRPFPMRVARPAHGVSTRRRKCAPSQPLKIRRGWNGQVTTSPISSHAVALSAYDLLTEPRLPHVKRCAGCHWLFLDESKSGSRWCSMADCGTQAKNAALRRPPRCPTADPGAHKVGP